MDTPWLKETGLLLAIGGASCLVSADDFRFGLQHNPFRKPQAVLEPAVEQASEPVAKEQPSSLILRGTLVSASRPLVDVEGEIVELGEEIGGFRLESVGEGAAVFIRDGSRYTFQVEQGDKKKHD